MVLELVIQYCQFCVYWIINYNIEDKIVGDFLKQQFQKFRFIILDLVDLIGNLGYSVCWDLLVKEVVVCMFFLCCVGWNGIFIQLWLVKVVV